METKKDYTGPNGYEDIYSSFGGKGLGKILSEKLSSKIDNLKIPTTYCVKIEEILEGKYLGNFSKLIDKDIVLKFSKIGDDFSILSERGKNSSLGLPKLKGDNNLIDTLKEIILSNELEENIKSIILDEKIKLPNRYLYLVIFDGTYIKIEISKNDNERLYYELNINGDIIQSESNSKNITHEEIPSDVFGKLLEIHKEIFNYFGEIPINTEGFYGNGEYIMIQVRPTPNELKTNYPIIEYDDDIYKNTSSTNFVYGIFDFEGFPQIITQENYLNSEKSIFILDEDTRWFSPLIKDRLEQGLPTLLIDTHNGFNISHDPKLLPHCGKIRDNFKYISFLGDEVLIDNKVRIISNGDKGEILIYNNI